MGQATELISYLSVLLEGGIATVLPVLNSMRQPGSRATRSVTAKYHVKLLLTIPNQDNVHSFIAR